MEAEPAQVADATQETPATEVTGRAILALAIPALGALLAEPLFVLADSAIVGHLGPAQLAGLGTAGAALNTLVNVCIFLAYSTTAQVSRLIGAGRRGEGLARGVDGMYLAAGLGLLLAVVGVLGADPIVRWLGAGAEAAPYAATYLRISSLGLPGMLLVLAATGLLRGLHDMRTPLVVAAAAAVINTLANWVLVYPCGLGIAGSAAGTAGVQSAMALAYAYIVVKACRRENVSARPNPRAVRASLSANFALLVRTIGLRVYLLAAVWAAGRLGTDALAANTIAQNLWFMLALALDALAIAAQALVGHELGAGRTDATRQVVARMNRWGLGFGVVTGVGLAALSPVLAGAFTNDQAVAAALMPVLLVAALFQPPAGVVFVLDGVLIGAGDATYLAWASLACTGVFLIGLAILFAAGGNLTWLWVVVGVFTLARLAFLYARARGTAWMRVGAHAG
ncbi:MATE family efflux transporter [Actinospica sp. MGRD01-02]|uniref:MATE family efflux transporter n=1 Tax=Actinospica acidithermotolerans TaxID=2828514 RepID=A0A941EP53_9ACTN|nr:MATE family efflux transporter [Actinospica acidithermotolerans]MBR7831184.1 MATE family efflux transporter [Actinospica acidithermotolerans]